MPGVRRDLREPYFQKTFSVFEWSEISDYLMQMRDAGPGLVVSSGTGTEIIKEPKGPVASETEETRKELEEERKEVEEEKATDGQT